jgi:hypothetical protein
VKQLFHVHGGTDIELKPFRKQRKTAGAITVKSLKAEVWDLFSEWVRRSAADEYGFCVCITCSRVLPWQQMQAGHFISRSHNLILFDEKNVHVQCSRCNVLLKGNIIVYQDFMLKTYGQSVIDELLRKAKITHKFTVFELNNIKNLYLKKLKEL